MGREEGRIVRLMRCDLTAPGDIASDLLDHTLAWLWWNHYDGGEGKYRIEPVQRMYDFGLDDDVPSDWLVWVEKEVRSVSVISDLRVLHGLGVRGNFVINEVGTMTFEEWELSDLHICTYTCEVTFDGEPSSVTPMAGREAKNDNSSSS